MPQTELLPEVVKGAVLSEDGRYRYRLWRHWGDGPKVAFVMLNPSTADADVDDPTIRRCMGFSRSWGYDGIEVINLYAYRATDPKDLSVYLGIEGDDNLDHWNQVLCDFATGPVVAAWGAWRPKVNGKIVRSRALNEWASWCAEEMWWRCLGTTKDGSPRHPLYVKGDQPLVVYAVEGREGSLDD